MIKYTLTNNQSWSPEDLRIELQETAGIQCDIHGHGAKCFHITAEDETGIDAIVQAHIEKDWQTIIADREYNAQVDAQLKEIDIASVRSIREYIAARPDAPQWLKDKETEATIARSLRKL